MCLSGNQSFCLLSSFSSEESELTQLPHPEQLPHFKLFILRRNVFGSREHFGKREMDFFFLQVLVSMLSEGTGEQLGRFSFEPRLHFLLGSTRQKGTRVLTS